MQLVARGELRLEDMAHNLLSAGNHLDAVTVQHLLTHTSGLPAIPALSEEGAQPVVAALSSPLSGFPGAAYLYSDTGYILLGEIVRKVSGKTLDRWFAEEIAPALHLEDSGFLPAKTLPIIATAEDESLDGLPHDPRARAMGGVAGHAGLFSSVRDMAAYSRALLGAGKALLPEPLFGRLFASELNPAIGFQSLAFFCLGNAYIPRIEGFSRQCVGHSGFTGCFLLIDKANDAAACLLTNRVLSADSDAPRFLDIRREWLTAAARDLGLTAADPSDTE
jgi:CubicO group peptidase (beta-lactamase class C family)